MAVDRREEVCGGMVKARMVAAGGSDVNRVPDYASYATNASRGCVGVWVCYSN